MASIIHKVWDFSVWLIITLGITINWGDVKGIIALLIAIVVGFYQIRSYVITVHNKKLEKKKLKMEIDRLIKEDEENA